MLFCDTASTQAQAFDDLVVFVSQLNALGIKARTGFGSVPPSASRNHQFDIAPHLGPDQVAPGEALVLIGAHELDDDTLIQLRRAHITPQTASYAIGTFPTPQSQIGVQAKLSYVMEGEPRVHALQLSDPTMPDRCPVFGVALPKAPTRGKPVVLLIAPDISQAHDARTLMSLALSRKMEPIVLTDGKTKQAWLAAHGNDIAVYHYGEILPAALAARVAVCATFAAPSKSYRMHCLLANLAVQGAALIDCTKGHKHVSTNPAFIAGPLDLVSLGTHIATQIMDVLPQIAQEVQASAFAQSVDPTQALAFLDHTPHPLHAPGRQAVPDGPTSCQRVVFMPTNGIGLGHAQRTSLIATALDRTTTKPVFAAFPSCMKMLQNYGFDVMPLVSRSALHAQEHANDLVNYARLGPLVQTCKAFVFDGGYVFDSIYRALAEHRPHSVWVRRGLWQDGQDNSIALDREKIFTRVIVPTEAFPELNQRYSRGGHIHEVGPIVQRTQMPPQDRAALRARLAERYGRPFEHLVVTMLGGGVAADRRAQIAAICAMMDRRDDTLNLIVVWPTATIEAGAFVWNNTRVVKTHHASALVAAADLFISAVGYNSFHEAMYNQVPAIFIPQMAAMMDDQRARAMAAVARGAAALVEPHEMLSLHQLVGEYLDGGRLQDVRAALAALDLPETGNSQAARMIEEMIA